jgi:hypothetical protein
MFALKNAAITLVKWEGGEMKKMYILVVIVLCLSLTSCAIKHDYVWSEYPIAAERVLIPVGTVQGQEVRILRGKSNDSKRFLGNVGVHQYYGSEQSLTEAIAEQFGKELQKLRCSVKDSAGKSLEITVNRAVFEQGMWKIAATIDFTVKFGNGKEKTFSVRNSSPGTVYGTYDGAIALGVIEMVNNSELMTYIKE